MKLLRYGPVGQEKPGLMDEDDNIRDLSAHVDDISGDVLLPEGLEKIAALNVSDLPVIEGSPRLGACVGNIGKFMCIGLNYTDHAAESGMPVPEEPILFAKFNSAISGPNDDVIMPRGSTKLDWEVEFGIVIGSKTKYISESQALEHIAGYCVINDVSERAYQLDGTGQWVKGKACDSFGPVGPWLVTKDEISDPQNLRLWLEVNGTRYQDGNTSTMIFSAAHIVSYLSNLFTLYPGDVIATGTPPGVGSGMKPPVFLQVGDKMRLGIDGLGEQNQVVVADQT